MPKTEQNQNGHTESFWARVDSIAALLMENDRYLHSKRNKELVEIVMQRFGIDERMSQNYIKHAKTITRKEAALKKEEAFKRAITDREFLFQKAKAPFKDDAGKIIGAPDYKLALDIIKDRDKLFGLYEENINIKGTVTSKVDLSGIATEDIIKLIHELKKTDTCTN
jgi:hypothetical protein